MNLLNATEIAVSIESIKTTGSKLDDSIHLTAVSALAHFSNPEIRDITLMNKLINAMPKSGRKNALVAWALHFGGVIMNQDKSTRAEAVLAYDKALYADRVFDVEAAEAMPFWEFKSMEGTPTWLFDNYIASVMKTLARHAKDTSTPEGRKAQAALDTLSSLEEAFKVTETPMPPPNPASPQAALPLVH